jgi:hypothetical protein
MPLTVKNLAETVDNNDYTRRNRFTGESIELTKEEAKKHDEIFYHEALATLEDKELGTGGSKHWQEMRDRLHWFRNIMRKHIWYYWTNILSHRCQASMCP